MSQSYSRIISLVPSLTELLIDLGLEEQLIGRTRFCVHPEEKVKDIPIVGGTKNPRVDKILDLEPDFVVANMEENRPDDIHSLQQASDAKVAVTEIATIQDAMLTIHRLGQEFNIIDRANELTKKISLQLDKRPDESSLRTAYFIWKDPWMTVGGNTYIHDVLRSWNLENVYGHKNRYPKIELTELASRNPELVLLSSEPYPFKEKHLSLIEEACPDARVLLVEGEWFSWYGSRMLHSFKKLNVWRKAIS